jgi:hypothetical protein
MKLFAIYIGGSAPGSLIELHDMRFVVADRIENTFAELKSSWWGIPESLHIDCWGELNCIDGYDIHLRPEPSNAEEKLYFVNTGGYHPDSFAELHKDLFVVAHTPSKAKVKALRQILDWKSHHEDSTYEVEKCFCLNSVVKGKDLYIHLEKNDHARSFQFTCKFMPLKAAR